MISKSLSRKHARAMWQSVYGLIPTGMHLHHKDGDAYNNELSNLMICTPKEHISLHAQLGHKIQPNFIGKADAIAKLSPIQKLSFLEKASAAGKRLRGHRRTDLNKLNCKLANKARAHPVEMVDCKTDKIVAEFFSVKEASEKLSLRRAHILRVIRGLRRTWRGHVFRYKIQRF